MRLIDRKTREIVQQIPEERVVRMAEEFKRASATKPPREELIGYRCSPSLLENEILQADPIRLVQLLYRAALAALGKARIHVREGKIVERSHQISKAGDIVNELTLSINRSQGGEIAATLVELYSYMQTRLQDANFRQVEEPLAEVETLLTTLLEAWE